MGINITVFISGSGSNLKAIIDACQKDTIDGQVIAVIADRECSGMNHAKEHHIPVYLVDRKQPKTTITDSLLHLIPKETHLIVLAGYLSVIPSELIKQYPKRIINLHPSLLPKYGGAGMYGLRVHEAVLAAKETQSGCSVHYVDEGIDTGEIIAQQGVAILPNDDAHTLQRRIQPFEHQLLVQTIANFAKTIKA